VALLRLSISASDAKWNPCAKHNSVAVFQLKNMEAESKSQKIIMEQHKADMLKATRECQAAVRGRTGDDCFTGILLGQSANYLLILWTNIYSAHIVLPQD
jgi:hypothetical protein